METLIRSLERRPTLSNSRRTLTDDMLVDRLSRQNRRTMMLGWCTTPVPSVALAVIGKEVVSVRGI